MPDLIDFDPRNPPLAKLHVTAQLDRDLARYKTGRSRVVWKAFPIRDRKTNQEVARLEFTSDGGIGVTFNIASTTERSWFISAQNLFDCIETADKLYVDANKPEAKAQAKAKLLRDVAKVPRVREAKKAMKKRNRR